MNKYMLLLFEDENGYANYTPEDMQKEIQLHAEWIESLGDAFVSGEALNEKSVSIKGKEKQLSDGPFLEAKELIGGFYILQAESFEVAVELSKNCPVLNLGGSVEVREVLDI